MNNQNEIKNVAQIIDWGIHKNNDNPSPPMYWARVVFRDGTDGRYDDLTKIEWLNMKAAELDAEMEELSAPPFSLVEDRTTRTEADQLIRTANDGVVFGYCDDDAVMSDYTDAVATVAAHCHAHPDDFGLCSWCKSYYNRITNKRLQLSDAQYELTTHPESNASHGVCLACKDKLSAEVKVRKEMRKS